MPLERKSITNQRSSSTLKIGESICDKKLSKYNPEEYCSQHTLPLTATSAKKLLVINLKAGSMPTNNWALAIKSRVGRRKTEEEVTRLPSASISYKRQGGKHRWQKRWTKQISSRVDERDNTTASSIGKHSQTYQTVDTDVLTSIQSLPQEQRSNRQPGCCMKKKPKWKRKLKRGCCRECNLDKTRENAKNNWGWERRWKREQTPAQQATLPVKNAG